MMPKELMILAGGSGTRIRDIIPGLPKALALVGDKTFLDYLLAYYHRKGIERFVFCLGEFQEQIIRHIEKNYPDINSEFVCETKPLGTGGAIRNALTRCREETVLIINGDSYFDIDLTGATAFHNSSAAECTILLKAMDHTVRYGKLTLASDGRVRDFKEKADTGAGLINGGVYLLEKTKFLQYSFPDKFSFEKEYLEQYFDRDRIYGISQEGYFIDIGTPEDLARAQTEIITHDSRLDQADR